MFYIKKEFINNNFIILLISRFISQLGDKIFLPAILWLAVSSEVGNSSKIGIISFVMVLPVLISFLIGVWVDRNKKKKIMIGTDAIRFLLCLLLFISQLTWNNFWIVVIVIFIIEVLGQFFNISSASVIPNIAKREEYLKANSHLAVVENITSLIGYAGGGFLIALLGINNLILFNAITFLLSGLLLLLIKINEENNVKESETELTSTKYVTFKREVIDGLSIVFKNKVVRTLLLAIFFINIATASLEMLITIWAHDVLNVSSAGYGILLTSILVGSLLGSILAQVKLISKIDAKITISISIICFGIFMGLVGVFPIYRISILLFVIVGTFFSLINIHFSTLIMKNIMKENLGKVFGIVQTSIRGGQPIGIALVTFILGLVKVKWIIIGIGIVIICNGAYLVLTFMTNNISNEVEAPKTINE